ncbi:MAG: ATP synthase subunit I [Smithellaceae bacterium]|nr:ATP synthase subunit I [Syntrophaceae bacterium]MDD4240264.1 ATP synthase subunit I [Smithellaceae bacterium]NLX52367.1 ATP synthase subunit I [Deltaproteobacteria bacterium]
MNNIVKDPLQKRLEIANWIILAILFIPSFIFAPTKFYLGVLLGGFISILNFYGMELGLKGLFRNPTGNVKRPTLVKYYLRLALTAVVLFFLITARTVDIIGLIIGLSVVVINIVFTMIVALAKKNFIEEVG